MEVPPQIRSHRPGKLRYPSAHELTLGCNKFPKDCQIVTMLKQTPVLKHPARQPASKAVAFVIELRMWTFLRPTSMIHGPSSGNGDSIMVHEHAPGHLHTVPEAIEHCRDVRTSSGACSSPVIPSFEHGTPRARNNRMECCVSVRRSLTRPLTVMHGAIGFSSSWCCEPLRCCLDDGREKHHKAKAKNDQDVSLNSQSQQLNRFSSHPSLSLFSS